MKNDTLHLVNEATSWENATPVGCGQMGAMLFGGIDRETLQLNEERFWSEPENAPVSEGFYERFLAVRERLLSGKSADSLAKELLSPHFTRIGSYETAGALTLDFSYEGDAVSKYRRDLDLTEGVATVSFLRGGVRYERTLFASYPADMIVFRLAADHPHAISLTLRYEREDAAVLVGTEGFSVTAKTACGKHVLHARIRVLASGGSCLPEGDALRITAADALEIRITLATDKEAAEPSARPYDELLSEHTADVAALMRRARVTYDEDATLSPLPIPERLARVKAGHTDAGLVNLYFSFGRYLLLSSSRGASLPANLQGVWNDKRKAVWNSDYHTNVNLQMNYWHAEVANLPECAEPLFSYMNESLLPGGERVAREYYHCRGTVLHHLSDIYGFASPADGVWGLWQAGGAWLSYAMWEHYLFSPDLDFLRKTAYPYISACVRFYLDFMFEDGTGHLATGPSTSPENTYLIEEDGNLVGQARGAISGEALAQGIGILLS